MRIQRRSLKKARIEIIPMIDTIFFLLVFFMISTLSMSQFKGMPVNLPKAASGQQAPAESAAISIDREGRLFLNRQAIDKSLLGESLKQQLAKNPDLLVVIKADDVVEHGRVVEVMDIARDDVLLARAQEQVPGWVMVMLRFQPHGDGSVTASIQGPDAFHPFQRSQLTLNRTTGAVVKWEPYANNSTGRKLRTWVRALHTGEAFGLPGQTVAGLASLGGCFLVWTGLAMAWRRFHSWRRTPKEFTAEESVMNANTDQSNFLNPHQTETVDVALAHPSSEVQTIESGGANGHAHAVQDLARERAAASFNGESVLILYGTVTGNSETLAKTLADALRSTGLTARVRDMAHCQPNVLTQANHLLVVASTYGDGEPPDDAAPFWHAVVHGNGLDLRGVRFSVLALGNTTYDHFCKCGRDFDAALERHGAARFYPRVDCDADYNRSAAAWINGVLINLQQESFTAISA